MKLSTGTIAWLCVGLMLLVARASAGNFGEITRYSFSCDYTRCGNSITYSWTCTQGSRSVALSFSVSFNRGYDYMQQVYQGLNHREDDFTALVCRDPFKCDLSVVGNQLRLLARQYRLNTVDVVRSFCQSLPYQDMEGYQRWGVECLIDGVGDCSDKSVLCAGLLAACGYNVLMLLFPGHMAVGVNARGYSGTYWPYQGGEYYYIETTSNTDVGEVPEEYARARATCYFVGAVNKYRRLGL